MGIAGIGAIYALMAVYCLRWMRQWPAEADRSLPSATILKPLYGAEPELQANLESFLAQEYPAPLRVVFGVHDAADPAVAAARAAMARYPGIETHLVIDTNRHGSNGKISNLINMMRDVRHDVVVLADSDMRVPPDYLRRVAAALGSPGVGLVTCLYHGLPVAGVWSRLSALAIDTHFLPSVLVALRLGLAKPCFGSTMALGRDTLAGAGGFEALKDRLADDYELGAAVRRLGLAIAIPPMLVSHCCSEKSFADLWSHEIRWARTIRLVDPMGFAGSVVTHPLPFALMALPVGGIGRLSLALLAAVLASRLAVQIQIRRMTGGRTADILLGPPRDLISFAVFVASFWPGRLTWRGESFGVDAGGSMSATKPGSKD